jgi:hypothetical protein
MPRFTKESVEYTNSILNHRCDENCNEECFKNEHFFAAVRGDFYEEEVEPER